MSDPTPTSAPTPAPIAKPQPFCFVDAHGKVVTSCDSLDPPQLPGLTTIAGVAPADHYRDGDAWQPMPVQADPAQVFDWVAKAWKDPRALAQIKAARWTEMKRHRDLLEASGFPYLGKRLDSDSRSVQRINTAVQAAQAALAVGEPFSITWTCADNTTLALDGAGMLGVPVALALYADQLHQACKTLRAQIEAATTPAAVQAIAWPASTSQE